VNDSCESNCGIRPNASGAHNLVARKPITPGEEITFDYAMRDYSVEYFPDHCRFGSCHCRDHITGWKNLPAQRKVDYHDFVAPYLISTDKKAAPGVASASNKPTPVTGLSSGATRPPSVTRWPRCGCGAAVRVGGLCRLTGSRSCSSVGGTTRVVDSAGG
jgi:hypothetical protein